MASVTSGQDKPDGRRGRIGPAVLSLAPWAVAAALGAAWWNARKPQGQPPAIAPPAPERVVAPQPIAPPEPVVGLSEAAPALDPVQVDADEPGRGRNATSPWEIPWLGWRDIAWRTWREMGEDRLNVVAGSVTYYTLLAIFPALGVFVSLYGLIADIQAVEAQLTQLSSIFPPEAVRLLGEQMVRLATGKAAGLSVAFLISLVFSLWSASAGMKSLFDGLNTAYDEAEKRSYVRRVLLAYGSTAALLVFLTMVSGILVAAPLVLEALRLRTELLIALRWPMVFAVATLAFTIAYRYGPSRRSARWRWVLPGGAAAALLWMGGSAGFSWYLNHVARLDATYGSLGAVIGFMLWVWFSVNVVLVGAEFSAEIEHQTACDTTIGPAKILGQRGASMADTVGRPFMGVRKGVGLLWGGARKQLAALRKRRPGRTHPQAPPAAPPGPQRSSVA